jgi:hypothetical protein
MRISIARWVKRCDAKRRRPSPNMAPATRLAMNVERKAFSDINIRFYGPTIGFKEQADVAH